MQSGEKTKRKGELMKIATDREKQFKMWLEKNGGISEQTPFSYAVEWANELEKLIKGETDAENVIWKNADATGRFVATKFHVQPSSGYAVNILSQYWVYGGIIRDWYNTESNAL
jgi:hypothetical protein